MNRRNFLAAATASLLGLGVIKKATPSDYIPALALNLRKTIGKKKPEIMSQLKKQFISGEVRGIQSTKLVITFIVYDEYASFNCHTSCNVSVDLDRKTMNELGRHKPYWRFV